MTKNGPASSDAATPSTSRCSTKPLTSSRSTAGNSGHNHGEAIYEDRLKLDPRLWHKVMVQRFRWIPGCGTSRITPENQAFIFDGFFHTQETDLYTSKKPYDFYAGGKGLDLRRMKLYGQRFGFDLSVESRRCNYIPTDRDLCPGKISACPHCQGPEDCLVSGGSAFTLSFPLGPRRGEVGSKTP